MDRKLVLAMAAAMALAVGCGDDGDGDGSSGSGYFGLMCAAAPTDCQPTAGAAFSSCCTLSGACGVTYDNGATCDTGCGQSPCLAAPAGQGCCDSSGMCGATQVDGSCAVTANGLCGTTECAAVTGHPGCCLGDGVTCGALYRGVCTATTTLNAALAGTGGGTGGTTGTTTTTTGTADAGVETIMCGANTCMGINLGALSAQPCCKDTGECGYDAAALGRGCVTLQELQNGGGDAGTTTTGGSDAGTTTGGLNDAGIVTDDSGAPNLCATIGAQVAAQAGGLAESCCTDSGECGIQTIITPCDPSQVTSFNNGMPIACTP